MNRYRYYSHDVQVYRDRLIEFAWSAPMRELAAKLEMSDVGLKKLLRGFDVFPPPQGYWNRVHAGRTVPERPKAPPRKPGESDRIGLDRRFLSIFQSDPPPNPDEPFGTENIPENLEELRAIELKAIGRVGVPKDLSHAHPGLADLLRSEERLRIKKASSEYSWTSGPKFEGPMDKRRLRIINGLFNALAKRGVGAHVYVVRDELNFSASVGDTGVGISIEPKVAVRRSQRSYFREEKAPASTPLCLTIHPVWAREFDESWCDDHEGKLESKIAAVAASIIAGGERGYRASVKEAAKRLETERLAIEEAYRKRVAAAQEKRIEDLKRSGKLLRKAQEIRSLVGLVKSAVGPGPLALSEDELERWETWANAYADTIDPVKSGQVLDHIRPPEVE